MATNHKVGGSTPSIPNPGAFGSGGPSAAGRLSVNPRTGHLHPYLRPPPMGEELKAGRSTNLPESRSPVAYSGGRASSKARPGVVNEKNISTQLPLGPSWAPEDLSKDGRKAGTSPLGGRRALEI